MSSAFHDHQSRFRSLPRTANIPVRVTPHVLTHINPPKNKPERVDSGFAAIGKVSPAKIYFRAIECVFRVCPRACSSRLTLLLRSSRATTSRRLESAYSFCRVSTRKLVDSPV